jgi:hypothetical protein
MKISSQDKQKKREEKRSTEYGTGQSEPEVVEERTQSRSANGKLGQYIFTQKKIRTVES